MATALKAEPVLTRPETPPWLAQLSSFASALQYEQLPPPVVARTKRVIADCIAVIAAGMQEPEVRRLLAERELPETGAHLIGASRLVPTEEAAFFGGLAGTMLELDEGNQYARGHPGIHVIPAVLAAAERVKASGSDVIAAVALGYEIGARIGIASKLRITMHPHGTWGTVGAAVAVAHLNRATKEQMREVINVSSCLGLTTSRRTMLEGGTVRNSYAGFSNKLGMMAWDMVRAGLTGEADGLSTVYGTVIADDWRPDEMVRDLGVHWEIARNYFKRHACCRYNHGTLDALLTLVAQHPGDIKPEKIARIDVATYIWAAQLASQEPHNMLAAKFSVPFSVATTIVHGAATIEAFRADAQRDARVTTLAKKVFVVEDAALTAQLPSLRPSRIRITLTDGRVYEAAASTNRGDTEDPYTAAEIGAKYMDLMVPVYGKSHAEQIAAAVDGLDRPVAASKTLNHTLAALTELL
jgi:2-methylcitrate dehydratase PrpD